MIRQYKNDPDMDAMMVSKDYIIFHSEGYFSENKKPRFRRQYIFPGIGVHKVRRNHPINIKKWKRSGDHVYLDHERNSFGCSQYYTGIEFFLTPENLDCYESPVLTTIDNTLKGKPISVIAQECGICRHDVSLAMPILQTMIPDYIKLNFLLKNHKIYSRKKISDRKYEGMIKISEEAAKQVTLDIIVPYLQQKYKSHFTLE